MCATRVEVELLDGSKKLLLRDWDRLYRITEREASKLVWSFKFPFLRRETTRYVEFYYQKYDNQRTSFDAHFKVKCTILQLAKLFGAENLVIPFNRIHDQHACKL